jgi:hypothetical protein
VSRRVAEINAVLDAVFCYLLRPMIAALQCLERDAPFSVIFDRSRQRHLLPSARREKERATNARIRPREWAEETRVAIKERSDAQPIPCPPRGYTVVLCEVAGIPLSLRLFSHELKLHRKNRIEDLRHNESNEQQAKR